MIHLRVRVVVLVLITLALAGCSRVQGTPRRGSDTSQPTPDRPVLPTYAYISPNRSLVIVMGNRDQQPSVSSVDSFSWSPSGEQMAITQSDVNGSFNLAILDVSKGQIIREKELQERSRVSWSPSGATVLVTSGTSASGSLMTVFDSFTLNPFFGPFVYSYGAFFSPSGSLLAIGEASVAEPPLPAENGDTCSVVLLDLASGERRVALQGDGRNSFSPMFWLDANRILVSALTVDTDSNCEQSYRCLSLANGSLGDVPQGITTYPWGIEQLRLKLPDSISTSLVSYVESPNGAVVACTVRTETGYSIRIVDLASRQVLRDIDGLSLQWVSGPARDGH